MSAQGCSLETVSKDGIDYVTCKTHDLLSVIRGKPMPMCVLISEKNIDCVYFRKAKKPVEPIDAVVLYVGQIKTKQYGKNTDTLRWVKVFVNGVDKPYLLPQRYNQQGVMDPDIRSGDIVSVVLTNEKLSQDGNVYFATAKDLKFLNHETIAYGVQFDLDHIKFSDFALFGYIEPLYGVMPLIDTFSGKKQVSRVRAMVTSSTWKRFQPDFDLAWSHNKIKNKIPDNERKEARIEVEGEFNVFYRSNGSVTLSATDNIVITRHGMGNFIKIIEDSELSKRWKQVRQKIREIMQLKKVLSVTDVEPLLKEHGIEPNGSVEEMLRSVTWKKDYEEQYFNYLKGKSGTNTVFFSDRGYFFQMDDKTVWETPKYGSATYVFRGNPSEVIAKLGDLDKLELLEVKEKIPEASYFFIDRVIHTEYEDWTQEVDALLRGV